MVVSRNFYKEEKPKTSMKKKNQEAKIEEVFFLNGD